MVHVLLSIPRQINRLGNGRSGSHISIYMKKQISDQVDRPTRTDDKTAEDVLGPETTEPSAYSHSDTEPVDEEEKRDREKSA